MDHKFLCISMYIICTCVKVTFRKTAANPKGLTRAVYMTEEKDIYPSNNSVYSFPCARCKVHDAHVYTYIVKSTVCNCCALSESW